MTLKELKDRVTVRRGLKYNSYYVFINYRGKDYECTSNNSDAWFRLDFSHSDREVLDGYTNKGAYMAFYEECLRANHLGKYKY